MNFQRLIDHPHPFVVDMREAHLRVLADLAMETRFSAGELIFHAGDLANRFYLIEQGDISISTPT